MVISQLYSYTEELQIWKLQLQSYIVQIVGEISILQLNIYKINIQKKEYMLMEPV